jgi:outer membrane lipoprotein-sorting protein
MTTEVAQMNQQSKHQRENEVPDDALQRAMASMLGETVPPGPPPELIAATLRRLRESDRPLYNSLPFVPRTKMMKLMTTAAGLLLTASLATLLVLAPKAPSSAFGQAVKQVREARSMSYTQLLTVEGAKEPIRSKEFVAADGRKRSELQSAGITTITIFDAAGMSRLMLLENLKQALVSDQANEATSLGPPNENQGRRAGNDFLGWLAALKRLGDKPDKDLGQQVFDGKRVTGFVATQGKFTFTMWVDDATQEPVRIEYDSPLQGTGYQHVAMTDFRFDENLDESLFSLAVPAGYTVQQEPAVPKVPGGEASVVEALRGWTKRDGGNFPASLTDWGPWSVLFTKDIGGGTLDAETVRVMGHLGAITPFLLSMPKDSYAYLGEGKTVEQKDSIVFWYKKQDGTFRAVYGDLSAKDVDAEGVPKK